VFGYYGATLRYSAVYATAMFLCACPSVRPFVTSRCYMRTTKRIVT